MSEDTDIVDCAHCSGTGSCNCDACWKANGLNPAYNPNDEHVFIKIFDRDTVPCKVCGGSGKIRVRSV